MTAHTSKLSLKIDWYSIGHADGLAGKKPKPPEMETRRAAYMAGWEKGQSERGENRV